MRQTICQPKLYVFCPVCIDCAHGYQMYSTSVFEGIFFLVRIFTLCLERQFHSLQRTRSFEHISIRLPNYWLLLLFLVFFFIRFLGRKYVYRFRRHFLCFVEKTHKRKFLRKIIYSVLLLFVTFQLLCVSFLLFK